MGAFEARFSMRTGGRAPLAALDLGAHKTACLLAAAPADNDREAAIGVLGAATLPLRRDAGDDARVRALRVAVDRALRMSGDVMPAFATAYAGPDLVTTRATGVIRVRKGVIDARDVGASVAAARASTDLEGRRLLHAQPVGYSIDDNEPILDPRGLDGQELAAEVVFVHAPIDEIAAREAVIEQCGLGAPAFIVAGPFAVARAVLTAEERDSGAVVIDLGDAGAGLAVFEDGVIQHAETVPGGGARLTLDLAARLGTTYAVAERAKVAHGGVGGDVEAGEAIEVPVLGADGRLEPGMALRSAFAEALAPRLEEIFERIAGRLAAADYPGGPDALGVALTGGVSHTPGLRALAQRILRRPVRIGHPIGFAGFDSGGDCASLAMAAGVLRCGFERLAAITPARTASQGQSALRVDGGRVFAQTFSWIKENF
jgi:cell division protein FtsA